MAGFAVVAVLALGNLLGGLAKGVTGFGSAILNLCVWISATHLRIPAGTLQQAVVSECISSAALALPLLLATKAASTCDWRLVLCLSAFGAAGAPIGAAMLTHLNARIVEFTMACVLVLVISLQVQLPQLIAQGLRKVLLKGSADSRDKGTLPHPLKQQQQQGAPAPSTPHKPPGAAARQRAALEVSPAKAQPMLLLLPGGGVQSGAAAAADHGAEPGSTNVLVEVQLRQGQNKGREPASVEAAKAAPMEAAAAGGGGGAAVTTACRRRTEGCCSSACCRSSEEQQQQQQEEEEEEEEGTDEAEEGELAGLLSGQQAPSAEVPLLGRRASAAAAAAGSAATDILEALEGPSSLPAAAATAGAAAAAEPSCWRQAAHLEEEAPMLAATTTTTTTHSSNSDDHSSRTEQAVSRKAAAATAAAAAGTPVWGPSGAASWREWWVLMRQPEQVARSCKVLGYGSAAGTMSGIMAGMTGMGGPPVMFMYHALSVPKEVVRGTSAVLNVLQLRIIAYLWLGTLQRTDTGLYLAASAAALLGMALGSLAAGRINQAAFSRVLVGLMVLCCTLMFVSALGKEGR